MRPAAKPVRPAANARFRAVSTSARRVADVLVYQKGNPEARFSSVRVFSGHEPSRIRAGAPLLRWGTLVKSRAKSPIFAPAALLVAGGFRELAHPPAGPVRPAANPSFRSKSTSARCVADVPVYQKDHPVGPVFLLPGFSVATSCHDASRGPAPATRCSGTEFWARFSHCLLENGPECPAAHSRRAQAQFG